MGRVSVLYSTDEIAERVQALAREIAAALPSDVLMVIVLKGAFVFAADLIRALNQVGVHPRVTFVSLSSYGLATESSGQVTMRGEMPEHVSGRRLLLVDDILDTGRTLAHAKKLLLDRGAREVRVCVLLDKPARREVPFEPDFVGFSVGDRFVVGYGIDYAEEFRDLPYLGALAEATPQSAQSDRRRRGRGR